MKKVWVITGCYDDYNKVSAIRVYEDEEQAKEDLEFLQEWASSSLNWEMHEVKVIGG